MYSKEEIQAAYEHWAGTDERIYGSGEGYFAERAERWHIYCDKRDQLPQGTSKNRKLNFFDFSPSRSIPGGLHV